MTTKTMDLHVEPSRNHGCCRMALCRRIGAKAIPMVFRRVRAYAARAGRRFTAYGCSIRPEAGSNVKNNNERRSIAAFNNFNPRGGKMKPKLVFYFMPKIRQGRNKVAKVMRLLPLLFAASLACAPAHGNCYNFATSPTYQFSRIGACAALSVSFTGTSESNLHFVYNNAYDACRMRVFNVWQCPVNHKYRNVNQMHSTWRNELAACQQTMTNAYNRFRGRMCD